MRTKKLLRQDQSGAVAMITVILLIFVFLIVTMGFLRFAVSEQRNAIDTDLKIRAYYAAESGVEDAIRIINRFNSDGNITPTEMGYLNGDICEPASPDGTDYGPLSTTLNTEITCQLIDFTAGDFVSSLGVNKAAFIPLIPPPDPNTGTITYPDRVVIEWHEIAEDGVVVARSSSSDLPAVDCWNTGEGGTCSGSQYPAMLRTGLFGHPNGAVTRADINSRNRVVYLNPVDGSGTVTVANLENPLISGGIAAINRPSDAPDCNDNGSGYYCRLEITGLSDINYLRLTPIYKGTNVRVTMYNGATKLDFDNVQAKIDVTARAGDVIRRIETRVPLRSVDVLPDEALTLADQLCKRVRIESDSAATDECDAP